MPTIWSANLDNGMALYGIENTELPLVNFQLSIKGGHTQDPDLKAGVASLMADLMNEGTQSKTAAELEEAIGLLGSSIYISAGVEQINITGSSLDRNFGKTIALVQEMLISPRWDETEFLRLKQELQTSLKGREANPRAIAAVNFNKLLYGQTHPYGVPTSGTLKSVSSITLDDVKQFYTNISPKVASFHVVGNVAKIQVEKTLESINNNWQATDVEMRSYDAPSHNNAGTLYFIDVPNAKQSVVYVGDIALSATNPDAKKLDFANEILGGGSSGRLFQTLRIGKGYTYGAYSRIPKRMDKAAFTISSSVRANATLASLQIIQQMVQDYGAGFTEKDVTLTQNKVIKANTRAFESFGAKLGLLSNISTYSKDLDYVDKEQELLASMTLEDFKTVINKYINENNMVYLVVGDKATQLSEVKKLGKPVIQLDIYGNKI